MQKKKITKIKLLNDQVLGTNVRWNGLMSVGVLDDLWPSQHEWLALLTVPGAKK